MMKIKIILILLFFISCSEKQKNDTKSFLEDTFSDNSFEKNKSKCNRILINYYDETIPYQNTTLDYSPFSIERVYETIEIEKINQFNKLLENSEKTGYCCCPNRNLTISFFDKTKEFDNYFVDNVEFKDKVRIYQTGFQFSYLVNIAEWQKFLDKIETITHNEYFESDLKKAREVYKYCQTQNLIIKTSNRVSKNWMNFDGEFKVKISNVGTELDEKEILNNIKEKYPSDKFEMEIISHSQNYGNDDKENGYQELIIQIFCNKPFHDKFKLYGPKSYFEKTYAEFYVLGSRENLNKIDKILKPEKK